jgi:hypothetical protein
MTSIDESGKAQLLHVELGEGMKRVFWEGTEEKADVNDRCLILNDSDRNGRISECA